ncbi:lysophospholipase L1-like esterase [Larkinella arboricola]|uniref:Lysophospholipase L1-like esterase n=1 Tax=Larkinella arboricola TaxID=643671 RepID=A0A327WX33_LARAB|nr:SGNH/GDSL hydrolase family protein [Larkinella arboricola]RAJ97882.1 lysophospholipase L1-like esterase [Larkinella arboricola]
MVINPDASAHAHTYLALGDSYTIGESVPARDRWSVQLAELLRKEGVDVADPDLIARTGWTTSELTEAIQRSGNQKTYGLVSLLIGVNNQYRGQDTGRYRTEFRDLLQTAIRFAADEPGRVFVLSIPDWGMTPYAANSRRDRQQIAREIDAFNAVAQEECQKAGIVYIDITPISRTAAGDASQIAEDGLHFSGKQYRLWAEKALPVVKKLL